MYILYIYTHIYIYAHTNLETSRYMVQDTMVRELHRLHAHSCIAKLTVVDGEPIKRQRKRCHICIYSTHQHRTSFCTSNCTIQTWWTAVGIHACTSMSNKKRMQNNQSNRAIRLKISAIPERCAIKVLDYICYKILKLCCTRIGTLEMKSTFEMESQKPA